MTEHDFLRERVVRAALRFVDHENATGDLLTAVADFKNCQCPDCRPPKTALPMPSDSDIEEEFRRHSVMMDYISTPHAQLGWRMMNEELVTKMLKALMGKVI